MTILRVHNFGSCPGWFDFTPYLVSAERPSIKVDVTSIGSFYDDDDGWDEPCDGDCDTCQCDDTETDEPCDEPETLPLSLYAAGAMSLQPMIWVLKATQNSPLFDLISGQIQKQYNAAKPFAANYKFDGELVSDDGETWQLTGCFVSLADYNDWTKDGDFNVSLTIVVDWATQEITTKEVTCV